MLTEFGSLLLGQLPSVADKGLVASTIPYKTAQMPVEQYGFNEAMVLIFFLILAAIVYLYLKKKNIGQFNLVKDRKVKVIERTRISARSSILLVQYNDRSFLMSQSTDTISLITEVETENTI